MYLDYKIEIGGLLHAVGPPYLFAGEFPRNPKSTLLRCTPAQTTTSSQQFDSLIPSGGCLLRLKFLPGPKSQDSSPLKDNRACDPPGPKITGFVLSQMTPHHRNNSPLACLKSQGRSSLVHPQTTGIVRSKCGQTPKRKPAKPYIARLCG